MIAQSDIDDFRLIELPQKLTRHETCKRNVAPFDLTDVTALLGDQPGLGRVLFLQRSLARERRLPQLVADAEDEQHQVEWNRKVPSPNEAVRQQREPGRIRDEQARDEQRRSRSNKPGGAVTGSCDRDRDRRNRAVAELERQVLDEWCSAYRLPAQRQKLLAEDARASNGEAGPDDPGRTLALGSQVEKRIVEEPLHCEERRVQNVVGQERRRQRDRRKPTRSVPRREVFDCSHSAAEGDERIRARPRQEGQAGRKRHEHEHGRRGDRAGQRVVQQPLAGREIERLRSPLAT